MKIQKREIEMINDNDKKWIIWTVNRIGESGKRAIRSAWGSRSSDLCFWENSLAFFFFPHANTLFNQLFFFKSQKKKQSRGKPLFSFLLWVEKQRRSNEYKKSGFIVFKVTIFRIHFSSSFLGESSSILLLSFFFT